MPNIWFGGRAGGWGIFIPVEQLTAHEWVDLHWVPDWPPPPWRRGRRFRLNTQTRHYYANGPWHGATLVIFVWEDAVLRPPVG